jgi:hypothetical protein
MPPSGESAAASRWRPSLPPIEQEAEGQSPSGDFNSHPEPGLHNAREPAMIRRQRLTPL